MSDPLFHAEHEDVTVNNIPPGALDRVKLGMQLGIGFTFGVSVVVTIAMLAQAALKAVFS